MKWALVMILISGIYANEVVPNTNEIPIPTIIDLDSGYQEPYYKVSDPVYVVCCKVSI